MIGCGECNSKEGGELLGWLWIGSFAGRHIFHPCKCNKKDNYERTIPTGEFKETKAKHNLEIEALNKKEKEKDEAEFERLRQKLGKP